MNKQNRLYKLSQGSETAVWAHVEIIKQDKRIAELEKELKSHKLIFVGYTNGSQIEYAKTEEGSFYSDTANECYIPLYMLKIHEHRIETTKKGCL